MPRTQPRPVRNRLNDLHPKEWLKFQKSWFILNPPPRQPGVLRHPAKFPEGLAAEFITVFTHRGAWALDPMVGTGSTALAPPPPSGARRQARGAGTQQRRRASADLDLVYSDDPADLGNIVDYDTFLDRLVDGSARPAARLFAPPRPHPLLQ